MTLFHNIISKLGCFALVLTLSACASNSNTNVGSSSTSMSSHDAQQPQTLYAQIGGTATLSKVFGLAISRIYNDPIIGHHFKGVPKTHLRKHLVAQTCELIGGPCKYEGKDMRKVHTGHRISDKEFFLLVEYVQGAMRDIGLTLEQENQILNKLAPLKADIVYL